MLVRDNILEIGILGYIRNQYKNNQSMTHRSAEKKNRDHNLAHARSSLVMSDSRNRSLVLAVAWWRPHLFPRWRQLSKSQHLSGCPSAQCDGTKVITSKKGSKSVNPPVDY